MQNFFQENEKNSGSFDEKLTRACEGLVYVSETDAPLIVFKSESPAALAAASIARIARIDAGDVEEVSFDSWFIKLTEERDWWGQREKDIAKRFAELREVLEESLRDLKVFRFGLIRIDVFVVGIDNEGRIAGVRTNAVET